MISANQARHSEAGMPSAVPNWLGAIVGAVAIVFGLLAIEHAVALNTGRMDLQTQLQAWLTSEAFMFGEGSVRNYIQPYYESASWRMGLHMAFGGTAVALGCLQFVPSLRRRNPRWHRINGSIVWTAAMLSMVGSIGFLLFVPMSKGASGPVFHMALWALTGLELLLLVQAGLAVLARDFRSHMIWMALAFAGLGTAPLLRVNWVVFAHLAEGRGHEMLNLATGTFVLLQTLLIMAAWLTWVGDKDLGSPRPANTSAWPRWVVVLLCVLSAVVAVREAVLAPMGMGDIFRAWRQPADQLPVARWVWCAGTVVAMVALPSAWRWALEGQRFSGPMTVSTVLVALGAVGNGLGFDDGSLARFGTSYFWVGYGVFVLIALALSFWVAPNSCGRNAWAFVVMAALWLPSQLDALLALGLFVGLTFSESMAQALVNGVGGIVAMGIATAYGARFRWRL